MDYSKLPVWVLSVLADLGDREAIKILEVRWFNKNYASSMG